MLMQHHRAGVNDDNDDNDDHSHHQHIDLVIVTTIVALRPPVMAPMPKQTRRKTPMPFQRVCGGTWPSAHRLERLRSPQHPLCRALRRPETVT